MITLLRSALRWWADTADHNALHEPQSDGTCLKVLIAQDGGLSAQNVLIPCDEHAAATIKQLSTNGF